MIKKVLTYCVPVYILLGILFFLLQPGHHDTGVAVFILALLIIAVTGFGLLLGLILCTVMQRPARERTFYLAGQILSFITFFGFAIYLWTSDPVDKISRPVEKESGLKSLPGINYYFVRTALDSLKLKFKQPDGLKINSTMAFEYDTLIGSHTDSMYFVYFSYSLKGNDGRVFNTAYSVLDHKAALFLPDSCHK